MNSNDVDDPDLKAAIAASLRECQGSQSNDGQASSGGHQRDVVDLTGDSDDDEVVQVFPKSNSVVGSGTDGEEDDDEEQLRKAIQLSMQGATEHEKREQSPTASSTKAKEASADVQEPPRPMGLLVLDRKQMEQERLARAAKRKAEANVSSSLSYRESKIPKTLAAPEARPSSSAVENVSVCKATLSGQTSSLHNAAPAENQPQAGIPSIEPGVQFPNGVVKKTWAFLNRRIGDDIKIEEVLQKKDLELAVLSSFQWDIEWLFSKLHTHTTRFILVMQAKEDATKRQYESETASMRNLRLCFPPMDGQVNCMHSKLMLLFHSQYVRLVVPTANLVPYDWGEQGGCMENSVFLIDLPKKKVDQASGGSSKTAFYDDLVYFLNASTLHENIIAKLDNYDFGKTAHIAFVHTIGGAHVGNAWRRTGYCGLGRAVSSLGLRTSKPLNIDYVTSSVGSLTNEFLRSIYLASQGDDGLTDFVLRTAKSFPAKSPGDPNRLVQKRTAEEFKERFRVYFPSETAVKNSRGGPGSAGTICFQSKWYEGTKFPRQVLRECISQRPKILMHNKILFARLDEPASMPDKSSCRAWAYVGSANLSESAWGLLVQDRTTKYPKLKCRNWECGVIIPVVDGNRNKKNTTEHVNDGNKNNSGLEGVDLVDAFLGVIPVPMQVPGRLYGPGLKPWFFLEDGHK
ncbi:hypothetical protein MAP00_006877 [Monascus purpureus]|nr:hypothetical protein MAP00_006877 [Monascus purpureus]